MTQGWARCHGGAKGGGEIGVLEVVGEIVSLNREVETGCGA